MQKHSWRQVRTLSSSSVRPSSRWGHSSCVVGQQILFFGGYADSNYMNDLWSFNTITMKWQQIQTSGDIPIQRSNCTMNYNKQTNKIIIFGGGGANKQRFNSISVLDWSTKNWIQITPKQNQQSPWQRTYHAAELLKNYLIIFGGEGVADMQDIWVFNFNTLSWIQIKLANDKPKPCARRFHSSVMIGNQFMIIAGCYGKYRCLSDIYSMDFTSLLETGSVEHLQWEQKKMKNSSFLTRWGHSSVVYDNKIYIFGGRFSNDLNDLLVADFETNSIRTIKTNQQAPPARRRHCAGFIGSSMLVFGGFNGQYFQDLHYISVHEPKSKIQLIMLQDQKMLLECINNQKYADQVIMSNSGKPFYINIGLMSKMFLNQQKMDQFLSNITGKYSIEQLKSIFITLYYGYGELNLQMNQKQYILYLQSIPQTKSDKILQQRQKIQKIQTQSGKQIQKTIKRAMNNQNILIKLCQQQFIQYYIQNKSKRYIDQCIKIGQNQYQLNRISLILKSQYFNNMFMRCRQSDRFTNLYNESQIQLVDLIGNQNKIVYEIFFNYLECGFLVVPDNVSVETYMNLAVIADYFLVNSISQVCSNQLISFISTENVQKILKFAIKMKISILIKSCCDYWIKKAFQNIHKFNELDLQVQINKTFIGSQKQVNENMMKMYSKLRFDLYQLFMEDDKKTIKGKNKENSNTNVEKENSENNILEQTTY